MKINPTDLFDKSSLALNILGKMADDVAYLRKKTERLSETYHLLIHYIHEGRITDTDYIDAAQAWLNHSNLEPAEIIAKVLDED